MALASIIDRCLGGGSGGEDVLDALEPCLLWLLLLPATLVLLPLPSLASMAVPILGWCSRELWLMRWLRILSMSPCTIKKNLV